MVSQRNCTGQCETFVCFEIVDGIEGIIACHRKVGTGLLLHCGIDFVVERSNVM